MERMKKFLLYFIMFLALWLFVELFTNLGMRENYKDITNHQIEISSPQVTIFESKATKYYGYIKGNIYNNTGEHIKDKYLQIDFYTENGIYLGTETKEINYFNIEETISFETNYEYKDVDNIRINLVDEVVRPEKQSFNIFKNVEEGTLKIAIPIAAILGLFVIIP